MITLNNFASLFFKHCSNSLNFYLLFVAICGWWTLHYHANTGTSPSSPGIVRNGQTGATTPASDLRNVQAVVFPMTAFTNHILQFVPLLNMSLLVLHHIFPMVFARATCKHEASKDGEPKGFICKEYSIVVVVWYSFRGPKIHFSSTCVFILKKWIFGAHNVLSK